MGNIRQKEPINENPDNDIYVYPVTKPRSQEMADRLKERQFPIADDLKPMIKRMGVTIIKDEQYQAPGDTPVLSKEDLEKQRDRNKGKFTYSSSNNHTSYYCH